MDKIDFVLPWVDGNDVEWQKSKSKYNKNHDADSNAIARFRDMGTLRYVLRAIEKNCPWYNKIYLITTGHYPEWLDINHEKIILISHDELYIDKSHLPVFSSSSIEMNLVNIKNLSDKFIYLNDDTIIMKRLEAFRFFIDDKPVDFLSHGWLARNAFFEKIRGRDTWVHSLNNNINLINKKFAPLSLNREVLYHHSYGLKTKISNFLLNSLYKRFIWIEHWHHPIPYLKQTLEETNQAFYKEMMHCSKNRFRDNSDLTQYLYRYWQLASGNFYPYKHNDGCDVDIVSFDYLQKMIKEIERYNFVCFNDQMIDVNDEEFENTKELLIDYLEKKLPNKASFEK